jgi:hypothetical protein
MVGRKDFPCLVRVLPRSSSSRAHDHTRSIYGQTEAELQRARLKISADAEGTNEVL